MDLLNRVRFCSEFSIFSTTRQLFIFLFFRLPVEIDGVDRACTASATVSTSKKDATVQCALEACRILDRHGALRGGSSRFRIKKKNLEENDYYDEDDDLFFDRTGQLEAQRDKRKLWTLVFSL